MAIKVANRSFFCLQLLIVALCITTDAIAQDSSFFARAAKGLNSQLVPEKVYVQTDKSYYAAGDSLWFKAYVTVGGRHQLSAISGILHVELVNYQDSVIQSIKLPLINGLTWGDITLPDSLATGSYRLRAYTNWMRNQGTESFFDKTITIVSPIVADAQAGRIPVKRHAKATKNLLSKFDVQFLPEGGTIVNGIRCKMAFKAVGADGKGREVHGVIADDANYVVSTFKSEYLGMGVFYFTPQNGRSYHASIIFPDSSRSVIALPTATDKGFVMNVNNQDENNVRVTVTVSPNLIDSKQVNKIYLLAQAGNEICYAAKNAVTSTAFTAIIPKSKFPPGVVRFTLFSESGEPLTERIVFIEPHNLLKLNVTSEGVVYNSRQHVKINMNVRDTCDIPTTGSFSASVVNESVVPYDEGSELTILSYILLTSDLKGYIEQPNYYFISTDANKLADLDLLMLTHGYRHFEWKQILNGEPQLVKYQPEKTLSISGDMRTLSGKPIAKGKVSLLSTQGGYMLLDTVTDEHGHFVFDKLLFTDTMKCKIRARTYKNGKNVVVTIDDPALPVAKSKKMTIGDDTAFRNNLDAYLKNNQSYLDQRVKDMPLDHVRVLKEVTIKAPKPVLVNSSNLNGPGNADQVILAKDFHPSASILQSIVGQLRGGVFLQYDIYGMPYPVDIINGKPVLMKIMLDGMLIDANTLAGLPVEIVESIEVLKSSEYTSIYGTDGYTGLILINTKRGDFAGAVSAPGMVTCIAKGYYKARVFYSPQYNNPESGRQKPDLRTTIFWKPNIVTDKDGKASFEYFNADTKGTYRIIVEGIDANGNVGRQVYRYAVN